MALPHVEAEMEDERPRLAEARRDRARDEHDRQDVPLQPSRFHQFSRDLLE